MNGIPLIQGRRINMGRVVALALVLTGCAINHEAPNQRALPAHARYVAMGSSFAAGPGISTSADQPPTRCNRSVDNYAHQLARKRDLQLVDVSCGGATTANILGPWDALPPQLDAITRDTLLVTVTIGGNDIGYIGCLIAASMTYGKDHVATEGWRCPIAANTSETAWQQLATSMRAIAAQVKQRAPAARLIFVDYPVVLPEQGVCLPTPLSTEQADVMRATAKRLAEVTAAVAHESHSELFAASMLSKGHDACAEVPWMNGFPRSNEKLIGAPYHPNIAGMTAIANALDEMLGH
jgi:lysophospholipase L1-like esterase